MRLILRLKMYQSFTSKRQERSRQLKAKEEMMMMRIVLKMLSFQGWLVTSKTKRELKNSLNTLSLKKTRKRKKMMKKDGKMKR